MADTLLINAALVLLGQEAIADGAAPRSKAEREVTRLADDVRRELLTKQRWTANLRFADVQADEGATAPSPYTKLGALPADWLKMWRAPGDWTVLADRKIAWREDALLKIEYAADVRTEVMDPLLRHACAARLAYRCFKTVSERTSDADFFKRLASQAELDAASSDALNRREAPLLTSQWLADESDRGWAP